MELRSVFIANLKKYRRLRKMSQMKIAEHCGTSASYIGEIEIGRKFPSVEMIERFAMVLGIRPHLLFMEEDVSDRADVKAALIRKIQKSVEEIVSAEDF